MNSLTQTAKGAIIGCSAYYLIHAHIVNRTHLISTSLQELSYQFRVLESDGEFIESNRPNRLEPTPISDRIKLNWNRSIQSLTQKAHDFNLSDSAIRWIDSVKSKFQSDPSDS